MNKEIQKGDVWLSRTGGVYLVEKAAESGWILKNLAYKNMKSGFEPVGSVVFGDLVYRPSVLPKVCPACGADLIGGDRGDRGDRELIRKIKAGCSILVLDIETTGFLKAGGSIVEVGCVKLHLESGRIFDVFSTLCREEIFGENHRRNGKGWIFDNSDLKYEDVLQAPSFSSIMGDLQNIINSYPLGCTAFNNAFDFGFLESRGICFPKKLDDPMKLATPICKLPKRNTRYSGYKLPNVEEAYSYFFPDREYRELHRGLDDARHEAEIVYELYKRGLFRVDSEHSLPRHEVVGGVAEGRGE